MKSLFTGPIGKILFALFLYVLLLVWLLFTLGLWKTEMLKDTAIWLTFVAGGLALQALDKGKTTIWIKKVILDSMKVSAFVAVIIDRYTFGVFAEIMLVFSLTLFGMMSIVAEYQKEKGAVKVKSLADSLQAILVIVVILNSAVRAFRDSGLFHGYSMLRNLALGSILTIMLTPFLYLIAIYSVYDLLFNRLLLGRERNPELNKWCKITLFKEYGLNLNGIVRFAERFSTKLMRVAEREDLRKLIREDKSAGMY